MALNIAQWAGLVLVNLSDFLTSWVWNLRWWAIMAVFTALGVLDVFLGLFLLKVDVFVVFAGKLAKIR
ncbi:MAG: hypothetical protein K0U41_05350 [Gammaproteobacteria bacterium]|nr:hypothetical protein [Gammaproteobacteria bacterium]